MHCFSKLYGTIWLTGNYSVCGDTSIFPSANQWMQNATNLPRQMSQQKGKRAMAFLRTTLCADTMGTLVMSKPVSRYLLQPHNYIVTNVNIYFKKNIHVILQIPQSPGNHLMPEDASLTAAGMDTVSFTFQFMTPEPHPPRGDSVWSTQNVLLWLYIYTCSTWL